MVDLQNNEKKKVKLLLIDEDPGSEILLSGIISNKMAYAYEIKTTYDDFSVFTILKTENIDLVILDLNSSDQQGFDILPEIKRKYPELPVLITVNIRDQHLKKVGMEIGADDFLEKPFNSLEINSRLDHHIQLKLTKDANKEYSKKLEQLLFLRTKQLALSEREATIGRLIQGLVHNMRSPIAILFSIKEVADLIKEKIEMLVAQNKDLSYQEIEEYLDKLWVAMNNIEHASSKLNGMIDNLMLKSSNNQKIKMYDIKLNELILREIKFFEAHLHFKHNTEKIINLAKEEVIVRAVPSSLSQVFGNLIKNSLDAMYDKKNCKITIETGIKEGLGFFSIEDNGPGIPQKIQKEIFDPFFSTKPQEIDNKNPQKPVGTGLGLHFVKETIESFSGKIKLDSIEKVGTRFTIFIPLAKNTAKVLDENKSSTKEIK